MADGLKPFHQTQYGFHPVTGNVQPFPQAKMPCVHTLASYLTSDKQEAPVQRDISFTLASYNIGAVAENVYTSGVTAFARKAYMLAEGFKKERLLVVEFEECRSEEGGTSQIGDYHRIIQIQRAKRQETWNFGSTQYFVGAKKILPHL